MILAGVDGIRRSLDPISLGYGPVEDTAEGKGEMLATSLTEASKALKDDHSYLSVFPDALLENWVEKKIKEELTVSRVPSPEEFKLYFDL
jgi:glutamine synthetase